MTPYDLVLLREIGSALAEILLVGAIDNFGRMSHKLAKMKLE
jgi:hypothetical protein